MKIIQSNFGTIKVIDPVVPDSRTTAQGTYGKYAAQIASGGRVKYQGAGLVDHGPEGVRQGYGRATKNDPLYKIKKGDELGIGITQSKSKTAKIGVGGYYHKRGGEQTTYARDPKDLIELNKKYGDVKLKAKGAPKTVSGWEHVTKLENWNDYLNSEDTWKRTKLEKPAKFNKTWWDSLTPNQRTHILSRYTGTFLPTKDKTPLLKISTLIGYKEKTLSAFYAALNPNYLKDIEPGSVKFYKAAQADRAFKLLESIGIEAPERINDIYYVNKLNKKQLAELEEIKKNKEKVIENRVSARTKREILINFSKASEEYRKGNYGAITYARDQVRKLINKAMAVMSESELRAYIQKNPVLLNMVENDVGVKGEIIKPINLKNLSLEEIINRVSIEADHIRPFEKAIVDPVTKQVLAGAGIHNPENIRLSTKMANNSFKRKATSFMDATINSTDSEIIKNRKSMKNYFKFTGQAIVEGPEYGGEIIGKTGDVSIAQQVKNLGIDAKTFFAKLPYTEQVQAARLLECPVSRKAEGGRIGFAEGTGSMLACMDAKFKENPKGFFTKVGGLASKGLDKLWKYASPMFLPAVQIGLGRAEHFKDPTNPEMYWDTILASDAVKRWGLDKAKLSQLKNASWLKRADIIGKLVLKFPGDAILKKMDWVAKRAVVPAELYQGYKGFTGELDLVRKYAEENDIPYKEAELAYLFSGSALKGRWNRASMFSKLGFGTLLPQVAYAAKNDQELQERGKKIHEYIKAYEQKPVEQEKVPEEVTKKIELPDMPKRSDYGIEENLQAENQPIGVNRYMQLIK